MHKTIDELTKSVKIALIEESIINGKKVDALFGTHALPDRRIKAVEAIIEKYKP